MQRQQKQREPQRLANRDEVRAAVRDLLGYAKRGLVILTPDLEPELYDHNMFLDGLKRFVLASSFARVRVLITHPERTMKLGNEFVTMGRRLNSYIEFRNSLPDLEGCDGAFCIADARAIVYRENAKDWNGLFTTDAEVARAYLERFDRLWQACESQTELRQLRM